jgi:hypothetical protein
MASSSCVAIKSTILAARCSVSDMECMLLGCLVPTQDTYVGMLPPIGWANFNLLSWGEIKSSQEAIPGAAGIAHSRWVEDFS